MVCAGAATLKPYLQLPNPTLLQIPTRNPNLESIGTLREKQLAG